MVEADAGFAQFVGEHRRALLKFAMVLTGDFRMTEDIVADVLGKAYERWDRIIVMDNPTAYVRRMIVNEHNSWRRRWARSRPTEPSRLLSRSEAPQQDSASDSEQIIAQLLCLSARERTVIVLRYYESLSDGSIADILGCREVTVRSHASRAMKKLRLQIEPSNLDRNLDQPIGGPDVHD